MKKILLALTLALVGLQLEAQMTPPPTAPRRQPRFGGTNTAPGMPRFPGAPGAPGTPAPGGLPGGPGAAPAPGTPGGAPLSTAYNASSTFAAQPEEMIAPGLIDFEGVDLSQVLDIYAKLVNRTLLRAALPQAQIILKTQTPLTKTEAVQALEAVLALNGVSLVSMGDKFVKVVPSDQAGAMGGDIDRGGSTNLPGLGSYVTHVVQLKYIKPTEMVPVIQPFSRLPNSILPIDGNGILVLRDYAENVKRMLEMIEQVDVSVPAEYISEVIPIRYSKVDDIANALNALGGSGSGAMVSIGGGSGSSQISGIANRGSSFNGLGGAGGSMGNGIGGAGGYGGNTGNSAFGARSSYTGQTTPNGTPSGGSSFQQRLQNIINSTGGSGGGGGAGGKQDQIQLFGQTKIIPNESSSSLLIYATRADMEVIKGIISKLDVPLAQVLVEAVILDVTLGNTFNFGASAAQNPASLNSSGSILGGGGMVNGSSPFISFMRNVSTTYTNVGGNSVPSSITSSVTSTSGTNGTFGNNLPGGLSYFANIGPNWDVAVNAAESDNHADIIQRPRIQTSQAKPAQFFVGNTVPYVTGTYDGYSGYGGNSYSQLSVGVELDVTPFINPDGLVVMDIQQEIDDLNGYTAIENVGNVPNTIKRTLNTEIAVRDRDTVMLGGFIRSDKSHTQSGVPFLSDIPLLGNLFKQRSDSKDREELIVLMRPTVLSTPEFAAKHTLVEEHRLPGVQQAASEDADYERSLINAEEKREQKSKHNSKDYDHYFERSDASDTNSVTGPTNTVPAASLDEASPAPQASVAPAPAAAPAALDTPARQQKAAAALMLNLNTTNAPANPSH
jgi:general secretion pathway protein D